MHVIDFLQASPLAFYIVVFVFGLLVGSFINVVIYRLPIMMERLWRQECSMLLEIETGANGDTDSKFDLITPRSRCPDCGHKISAWENIPVISYLILRGKCLECKKPIPLRYPMIELLCAITGLVVAVHFLCPVPVGNSINLGTDYS